ncbi:hypothetical protein Tco_0953355 [Tanacetum coccineum]|uniref:Uncharacterized protein n=1 Tax=Tanacetum coccineum TaxID=301880 RepID=A0ABQ5DZN3_9ASTR
MEFRKQGNNEDTSSKAMLAIDGVGFDWSDMAEEQVQTNMALMAFSDSEVYNDKTCSKTCLKNYETLKKQCDDLIVKLNQTEFTVATYKRGLATVEEQLITYRKNEVLFSEEVAVLKREVACKDYEINVLKSEFEKVKQEKEGIEFKIEKFDKASKDLDKLLGSQITDKSKKGLGYNVVPPPHPLIYNRPKKLDLSYYGLDEFKEPEFKGYGSENSKQESNIICDQKLDDSKENSDDSLVKEQVSEDTSSLVESSLNVDKETVFPVDKKVEFVKPKNHEKLVKKSVRYAEMYRSQTPRGNQRNWNGQKSNQLGSDFVIYNKACFICGSFNYVHAQCKYHQRERMVYGNNYNRVNYNYTTKRTHPNAQRNIVPRSVLMKAGLKPFNTARTVNTAHPKSIVFSAKPMHVKRGRDTKIPQSSGPPEKVGDEVVHKELGDIMERAATTASSLEAEQDSAKANTVNGERQLQALVDKKRVIITESSIRSDLHLTDVGGIDCFPTATIFEELARMGAKSTAWNKFSSTMASAIICLAINQKFNLSKYIFDDMVKHLEEGVKFLISNTKQLSLRGKVGQTRDSAVQLGISIFPQSEPSQWMRLVLIVEIGQCKLSFELPLGICPLFGLWIIPPPPPLPAGASGAPSTSGASGSSQFLLPPPPPSTGTFGFAQQQGSKAPSSSKTAAFASQFMAWTTSDTQYESANIPGAQELSPTDYLMQDDSIPEEQVHLSDEEDSENDHQPKANSRKDWWKPLPEEERPATPEPAWTIPSSNKSDVVNN